MAGMNEKDYYALLGVEKDASKDEIRRAFQKKARKLHPDVNKAPDAEERFKEVSEAYAVLSDDTKRARYDAMRSGVPFGGTGGTAQGAPYGGGSYGGYGPFGWGFPFGAAGASRRRSRAYNPQAGADVTLEIEVDLDKAKEGFKRGVTYQRYASCDACGGSGSVHAEHSRTCPTCKGTGRMTINLEDILGFGFMDVECPECQGSGKVVADPCEACGGTGRNLTASEVVVEVPADTHDGDQVRVEGMGNAGTNGSTSGDFVCTVRVKEERLTANQLLGCRSIGTAVALAVVSLVFGLYMTVLPAAAVILAFGVVWVARDGIIRPGRWWRNAGGAIAAAASAWLPVAFILLLPFAMVS